MYHEQVTRTPTLECTLEYLRKLNSYSALEHRYESNRLQSSYAKKYGEWKRDVEAKMKDYGMKDNLTLLKKRSSEKKDDDEPPPPAPPLLKSKSTKGRSEMRQRHAEEGMARYNFLIVVAHEISNIVKRYTTHCIICGDALSYPGAKPTVCNDKLCHYEYVLLIYIYILERVVRVRSTRTYQ